MLMVDGSSGRMHAIIQRNANMDGAVEDCVKLLEGPKRNVLRD